MKEKRKNINADDIQAMVAEVISEKELRDSEPSKKAVTKILDQIARGRVETYQTGWLIVHVFRPFACFRDPYWDAGLVIKMLKSAGFEQIKCWQNGFFHDQFDLLIDSSKKEYDPYE